MKRSAVPFLLLIASSLLVFGGSEQTATISRDGSWTGFYLGGTIGYGATTNGSGSFYDPSTTKPSSLIGGGEAGYNYEFDPHWLVGGVADFSGADFSKTRRGVGFSAFPGQPEISFRQKQSLDWFGTVRGQFGYVFARKFLVFGTGGFAYADVENEFSYSFLFLNRAGRDTSRNTTATGWCGGGGLAYALTDHWRVKAQYLYVDVEDHSSQTLFTNKMHTGTCGIEYQF